MLVLHDDAPGECTLWSAARPPRHQGRCLHSGDTDQRIKNDWTRIFPVE
jgi:hypothetical protein